MSVKLLYVCLWLTVTVRGYTVKCSSQLAVCRYGSQLVCCHSVRQHWLHCC